MAETVLEEVQYVLVDISLRCTVPRMFWLVV